VRKDRESLAREAEDRLRRILVHAYDTSPYYRDAWNAIGFHPGSSHTSADLQQLPLLTKDIIKEHKSSLVSERFREDELDLSFTGGTTGTQTSFYRDHACTIRRVGRQWGVLELCGYRPGMRRGLVWGIHEDLPAQGVHGSFRQWFRRYASGQETLCCTVLNERLMMDFHRRLLRFRPAVLYGYPSALSQLGRFIEDRNLEPIRARTIITTAERLRAANRTRLMQVYEGEVFNLYCTREHGCIGFECRRHQGFHIDTGSVLLETVRDDRPVASGQAGEIVITDLLNYGMPFIRSRTGDMGVRSTQPCECGSPLPLLKELDGRSSELIYRPDGSVVPGIMLTDLFMDLPSVRYSQFVQESTNHLDVLLVVSGALSEQLRRQVIHQVRALVGEDIAVRVRRVDDIERSRRSGKIREIVSRVDPRAVPGPLSGALAQE
jgi:phenylacetate-CoA ligase